MQIEQDILVNVCGEQHVYVYQTEDFWLQIKSAGYSFFLSVIHIAVE